MRRRTGSSASTSPGTFAERVVLPARNVFPVPAGLSFAEAAAFPLAYQTAWRMIVGRAAVRPGETVLIHGVGGGVGGRGPRDRAALRGARDRDDVGRGEERRAKDGRGGARRRLPLGGRREGGPIAHRQARRRRRRRHGRRGDLDDLAQVRRRSAGRIVTCGATSGPNPKEEIRLVFWKQLSILGSTMANDREFRALYAAVAAQRLRPKIDRIFPLDAVCAYRRMEEGSSTERSSWFRKTSPPLRSGPAPCGAPVSGSPGCGLGRSPGPSLRCGSRGVSLTLLRSSDFSRRERSTVTADTDCPATPSPGGRRAGTLPRASAGRARAAATARREDSMRHVTIGKANVQPSRRTTTSPGSLPEDSARREAREGRAPGEVPLRRESAAFGASSARGRASVAIIAPCPHGPAGASPPAKNP